MKTANILMYVVEFTFLMLVALTLLVHSNGIKRIDSRIDSLENRAKDTPMARTLQGVGSGDMGDGKEGWMWNPPTVIQHLNGRAGVVLAPRRQKYPKPVMIDTAYRCDAPGAGWYKVRVYYYNSYPWQRFENIGERIFIGTDTTNGAKP